MISSRGRVTLALLALLLLVLIGAIVQQATSADPPAPSGSAVTPVVLR